MFRQNMFLLNSTYCRLRSLPEAAQPLGRLVCSGLALFVRRAEEFDDNIHPNPSLQEHFLSLMTSGPTSGDTLWWLEVFEDIALFVREKCLRCGAVRHSAERAILYYFESCGEWSVSSSTLVCRMYWHMLPKRCRVRRNL